MEIDKNLLNDTTKRLIVRFPMFAEEFAKTKMDFCEENSKITTAATDGEKIYVNFKYFNSLTEDERLFLIAHEFLHIKFEHMFRLKDEKGVMRDNKIWNIATDAIINANLQRDGFKMIEGGVNISNAINFTAEELYTILQKENDNQNNSLKKITMRNKITNHNLWANAFNKTENESSTQDNSKNELDEKQSLNENRDLRKKIAVESLSKMAEKGLTETREEKFEKIGRAKPVVDWRLVLKREMENNETIWSQRKSVAENNYAYRLEDNEDEDALTEVLVDTSGSVSNELIKSFLKQLKPLLFNSKLKVGCFDTEFYGFSEIRTEKDIEKFKIRGRGGTDFNQAVQHFTPKRAVNKIVFTDGYDEMSLTDKNYANIIWIVYENKYFKPSTGKVILVKPSKIEKNSKEKDYEY